MQVSYSFRNYLLKVVIKKKGLISYSDFSRIPEESQNTKSIILNLSQVLDVQIRSSPIGTFYSELAQRVFKYFFYHQQERALKSSLEIKALSSTREKMRFFFRWSKILGQPSDRLSTLSYLKEYSRPASHSVSQSVRSQSLSVKSEAKQLLSSSSSKPLIRGRVESVFDHNSRKSPFNRLYDHAANKEVTLEKNRTDFIMREMEECTFRPKVNCDVDRAGNVFDRLSQSDSRIRDTIGLNYKEVQEMQECTFSPKINPPKSPYKEKAFEKLYNDAEAQRKKFMEKELQQKHSEVIDCTFRPNINGNSGQVTAGNVYEKLYNNFQEIQKQRIKKQLAGQLEEAEVQFVPKLMTQAEGPGKYSRLYAEVEKKKRPEKERSSSAPRRKKSDEIPRFEHLYALHREKQERQVVMQDRYLKETGVVFKPNLAKTLTPKSKRDSPKMAYPLPRNPNLDSASLSSFN
jgi:hypothetical protein